MLVSSSKLKPSCWTSLILTMKNPKYFTILGFLLLSKQKMATALISRTLSAHSSFPSSLSHSHKPRFFSSFFDKRSLHFQVAITHLAYKTSGPFSSHMAMSIVSRSSFSALSISTDEPVVSVDWLHANLLNPDMEVAHIPGALDENIKLEYAEDQPKDSRELLMRWGCTEKDASKIFLRRPSLRKTNLANLQSKLNILRELGLSPSDLVKVVNCRPRFLSCRINHFFDERLQFFQVLFGSREVLRKAITRNPSLLIYDLHNKVKPAIEIYDKLGVSRRDLVLMLMSRPTLIPRTFFNDEKLEYIRKTKVTKDSKMYKYVVCLIGISRLETIREKMENLEKFGFSDDEVLGLFGRSPLVLTLSIEKVQRNMTFVLGTMKLPASVVLHQPFLLYSNLEVVLKPRVLLAGKIHDMGLQPQIKGPALLRALRMKEKRFVEAFVLCHQEDVANELIKYYKNAKGVKRLAESSKKTVHNGFPF